MPVAASLNRQPGLGLNEFQKVLVGTWTNQPLPGAQNGEGGTENPLSFNVMPLPQASAEAGYILKNFAYYETLLFNGDDTVALPATAPNRGTDSLQLPTALFYSQQVHFAEGPGKGAVVHVENGAWLNIQTGETLTGPYPPPDPSGGGSGLVLVPNQQPRDLSIAKQISVPHGNSILAPGGFTHARDGAPTIPPSSTVYPRPAMGAPGIDTTPYDTTIDQGADYENPSPDLTKDPNTQLQTAVAMIKPSKFIEWRVSTGYQGHVVNLPFEEREANVTAYEASYWLLAGDDGEFRYLAYTQTIDMTLTVNGAHYTFPHVTCNVVTKAS